MLSLLALFGNNYTTQKEGGKSRQIFKIKNVEDVAIISWNIFCFLTTGTSDLLLLVGVLGFLWTGFIVVSERQRSQQLEKIVVYIFIALICILFQL
jgi:hypothetical protein